MAIATKNVSKLKIRFQTGEDDLTGKIKTKAKIFSNVKPGASNDDVYAVGEILVSLQGFSMIEIAKIDDTTLSA